MINPQTATCLVDGKVYAIGDGLFLSDLEPKLANIIRNDYPKATKNSFICNPHLLTYRLERMRRQQRQDARAHDKINRKMSQALVKDNFQLTNVYDNMEATITFGERIADAVAKYAGSWPFIIIFSGFMIVWMILNTVGIFGAKFDPFPFILLNLFLSMIAALQAPLIMMSQNRAAEYDRLEAKNDYHVNLKSEEEIRLLHSKLDHIISDDNPNLFESQRLTVEVLGEMVNQLTETRQQLELLKATQDQANKDIAIDQKNKTNE